MELILEVPYNPYDCVCEEDHINETLKKEFFDRILSCWKKEHDGYYGKPHGIQQILHNLESTPLGFSEAPISRIKGWRWLTAGGNDHRIGTANGSFVVGYQGRRHGMRKEFKDFLIMYWQNADSKKIFKTQTPDMLPWLTNS